MPPRTKIKKEDIIRTTFEIVRKEGLESVNARRVAKELNCSVQPIFSNFSNMNDLKEEVLQLAYNKYIEYITSSEKDTDNQYKSIGVNYIRLAREEPKLFQILFMSQSNLTLDAFMKDNQTLDYVKNAIMKYENVEIEDITLFHIKMWFFTHGIASLIANDTCIFTDEEIDKLLTEEFIALTLLEKYKKEKK